MFPPKVNAPTALYGMRRMYAQPKRNASLHGMQWGKWMFPPKVKSANGAHPPASAGGWVGIRQRNAEICGMRRDGGHNATRCVMTPRRARPTIARLFIYQRRAYLFMDRSSIMKNAESNGNPDERGPAFGSAGIARNAGDDCGGILTRCAAWRVQQ